MAPKRPHPLATSTLPSPSRRRARPRPSYGNESDEASDIDLASEDDDASDDDDTAVGSARAPAAAAAAAPTSEDVLLLGSEDEESLPLTPVKVLEKRIVAEPRRSSAASPAPVTTTAAARRVQARPRASTATSTTASHRRSSTSSGGGGATGRRVSSTVQQEPETGSGRPPALVLPLPLVSYVLERLLQPDVLPSIPAASTALPAFSSRPTAAWSLIRHALSPVGGGSTLSPREEVELRRLEGWVGLRVLRESTGGSDAQGRHATADEGRELERGLAKAVRPGLAGAS
jgi:hypothetical protein